MPATDQQVQQFVDNRVRPRCEQIRALLLSCEDDKAEIQDIYDALNAETPTWSDTRTDAPHSLVPSDVLAWNTFVTNLITAFRADAQLPIIEKSCVRGVLGG